MNSVTEILQLYSFEDGIELHDFNSSMAQNVHMNFPKIKQKIINSLRTHQMQSIQSNKKLQFYSSSKMTQDASVQIDLIKNLQHRQSVVKLRSGNHDLRIETGRHCVPKIPENVRICQHCSSNNIENELHFIFDCSLHSHARERLFDDITFKYPIFTNLSTTDKTLFLFNNVDPFICEKN